MSTSPSREDRRIADQAAAWVVRQERGLTAVEQDVFSQWLAEDPRHRAALAEQRWSWEELDRLNGLQATMGAVPDARLLVTPPRRRSFRWLVWTGGSLAAAAALVGLLYFGASTPREPNAPVPLELLRPCEQKVLADGSVVDLNRGAMIKVAFSAAERRVRLESGEAHFTVTPDATRPFMVEAAGVAVRAVGTAFSVAHEAGAVSVLVTEGKVAVAPPSLPISASAPVVPAGHRAVVPLTLETESPTISRLTTEEVATHLAWKPRLLEFDDAPLAEIAAEFNRHNPVKLTLADSALSQRRLSASIRSDNLEGFVKLLESDFGLRAERRGPNIIALQRKK